MRMPPNASVSWHQSKLPVVDYDGKWASIIFFHTKNLWLYNPGFRMSFPHPCAILCKVCLCCKSLDVLLGHSFLALWPLSWMPSRKVTPLGTQCNYIGVNMYVYIYICGKYIQIYIVILQYTYMNNCIYLNIKSTWIIYIRHMQECTAVIETNPWAPQANPPFSTLKGPLRALWVSLWRWCFPSTCTPTNCVHHGARLEKHKRSAEVVTVHQATRKKVKYTRINWWRLLTSANINSIWPGQGRNVGTLCRPGNPGKPRPWGWPGPELGPWVCANSP